MAVDYADKIQKLLEMQAKALEKEEEKQRKEKEKEDRLLDLKHKLESQDLRFEIKDHTTYATNAIKVIQGKSEVKPVYTEGEMWKYNSKVGAWLSIPEDGPKSISGVIKSFSGLLIDNFKSETKITINENDISGTCKGIYRECKDDSFFKNKVSCSFMNGYLEISDSDLTLVPHHESHRCRFYHPFNYDPEAKCPKFMQFLDDLFQNDPDAEDKKTFLCQFLGACLLGRAAKHQRCLILHGTTGDNAKSTIKQIFDGLFPSEFRTTLPPKDWGSNFLLLNLVNKRLNYVAELPENKDIRSEIFKQIISGDTITTDVKFKGSIQFKPTAGHIFAVNKLPDVTDSNEAFWKRWVIIQLNRKFEIHEQVIDKHLDVLTEREQIINYCINSYKQVLINKDYITISSSLESKEEWKDNTDAIRLFLKETCEFQSDKDDWDRVEDLYEEYKNYCKRSGNISVKKTKFSQNVRDIHKLRAVDCKVGGIMKLPYTIKPADRIEDRSDNFSSIQSISNQLKKNDDTKTYCGVSDATIKYLASKIEPESEEDEIKKRWFKEVVNGEGE